MNHKQNSVCSQQHYDVLLLLQKMIAMVEQSKCANKSSSTRELYFLMFALRGHSILLHRWPLERRGPT